MNKALRQSIRSAQQRGLCLLCGPDRPCSCTPSRGLIPLPSEQREVFDLADDKPVLTWHLCEACLGLIKLPERRPAVRCPGCGNVN